MAFTHLEQINDLVIPFLYGHTGYPANERYTQTHNSLPLHQNQIKELDDLFCDWLALNVPFILMKM